MKNVNPHDKFFKETFSKKEEAIDLICHTFPEILVKNLDLATLALDNNSYVDEELGENFSDLVYNCNYGEQKVVKICLLFEHKSYPVPYPHLQLLKYLLKIWESNEKQKQALVPVIPVVVYHGKEKWTYKQFSDYIEGADGLLEPFVPNFDYLLTDLSAFTDREIKQLFRLVSVRTSLLLMKNIFDKEGLLKKLHDIFIDIDHIQGKEPGKKFLMTAILYLYYGFNIDTKKLLEILNSIPLKGGNIAMTTATILIKEGEEKAHADMIVKLFVKSNYSVEQIVDFMEIERDFVEKVLKEKGLIK